MGMVEDLIAQLDALDGREVTVTQTAAPAERPLSQAELERIAAGFNRRGGPKLLPHVIQS